MGNSWGQWRGPRIDTLEDPVWIKEVSSGERGTGACRGHTCRAVRLHRSMTWRPIRVDSSTRYRGKGGRGYETAAASCVCLPQASACSPFVAFGVVMVGIAVVFVVLDTGHGTKNLTDEKHHRGCQIYNAEHNSIRSETLRLARQIATK